MKLCEDGRDGYLPTVIITSCFTSSFGDGDYRQLNAVTPADRYRIHHIHDFAGNWTECSIFSTLDLIKAYNQIPIAEEHVYKTVVTTPFGLHEFVRMHYKIMFCI